MFAWTIFDLVKVNSGYYLFDIEYESRFEADGKVVLFENYGKAEEYLVDNDIRATIRNVVSEID